MSHVLPITWHLIISLCFSTQNWFLIFPASIGNTLRNPPLYLDGRVKHHIEGRSDKYFFPKNEKMVDNLLRKTNQASQKPSCPCVSQWLGIWQTTVVPP